MTTIDLTAAASARGNRGTAITASRSAHCTVITVCDTANDTCPVFPKKTRRLHWSFQDPSLATGTEDERLQVFQRVRDQIKRRLSDWIKTQ